MPPFLPRLLALAAAVVLTGIAAVPAGAQAPADYPARLVKIIVPTAAGGATDLTARSAAPALADALGQTFLIDNRPGAHGLAAASTLLKEPHDGYTLMMMSTSQSALPAVFSNIPYDPVNDFSPIALLSTAPVILVVNANLPVHSLADLIRYAKEHPKEITYGYQSNTTWLSCAQFAKLAGFEAVGVPFGGSAQVATEMLAGRLTFTLMTSEQAKAYVDAGHLRALATGGTNRAMAFAQVPTMQELGYPIEGTGWFGLVGPVGTPQPIVDKLYAALKSHYIAKAGQAAIVRAGLEPGDEGPAAFAARMKREIARWISLSTELGMKKSKL